MDKLTIFLLAILLSITNQKIKIAQPIELKVEFSYEIIQASYGNFGLLVNGFNARGRVYTPVNVEDDPNYACKDFKIEFSRSSLFDISEYFPIIIVHKGNCSFTTMARNIQKAGGKTALIVNDNNGDVKDVSVLDDGSGSDVKIPVALISLSDGTKLINFVKNNPLKSVQLEIEFTFQKTDTVNIDLYTNIADVETFVLLKEFSEYFKSIKNNVIFNVYYITYAIEGLDIEDQRKFCISRGRYCFNNRLPKSSNYYGRDLIVDSLYHQCLFKSAFSKKSESTYNPEAYFNFATNYYDNCLFSKYYVKFCGSETVTQYKNDINKCIIGSFGLDPSYVTSVNSIDFESENYILKDNIQKVSAKKIRAFPTVEINNKKYEGRLSGENLFLTVCTTFNYMPDACKDFLNLSNSTSGVNWSLIIFILVMFVVVNIAIVYICRKYIIKKINERFSNGIFDIDGKINSVVSSYFALKDKTNTID